MLSFSGLRAWFLLKTRLDLHVSTTYLSQTANRLPVTIVPRTDNCVPVDKMLIRPHTGQHAATHGMICDSMSRTTDSKVSVPQTNTEA